VKMSSTTARKYSITKAHCIGLVKKHAIGPTSHANRSAIRENKPQEAYLKSVVTVELHRTRSSAPSCSHSTAKQEELKWMPAVRMGHQLTTRQESAAADTSE
jgi:hypothetical protein